MEELLTIKPQTTQQVGHLAATGKAAAQSQRLYFVAGKSSRTESPGTYQVFATSERIKTLMPAKLQAAPWRAYEN